MISLNGEQIKPTLFPDGTSQVWQIPEHLLTGDLAEIQWDFSSEADLIHLAQLKQLIDYEHYKLTIPYLPYARQDKEISNSDTFALHTFAEILNFLDFDAVFSIDVHSSLAEKLIKNFNNIDPIDYIDSAIQKCQPNIVCYPDGGAAGRYGIVPNITGFKKRDPLTGKILIYELQGECRAKKVLIVDDICDGGMTFKLLADQLLDHGALEVHLYVTHGIFSKGLKTLRESGIKRIFTHRGEVHEVQGNIVYQP